MQRFEDHDRAALAARVTVGGVVEGLGSSFGAEEPTLGFRDGGVGADHDVDAAGERDLTFTVPDALGRKVNGDQRGRARRIDRHAGAAEVEGVRDAVRQHGHHHPGGGMRLESVPAGEALVLQELVVERETPDEHPDVGAGQCVGGDSAVFQRLPGGLQQQALLRVEGVRLARRDSEELGVELVDLAEETASAGDDLAGLARAGIVIAGSVPSCFGNGPGGVDFAAQQIPEALR